MPVAPALRTAFFALAVLILAVSCNGAEPPQPVTAAPTSVTSTSYLMFTDDSVGPVCTHLNRPYSDRDCPDTTMYAMFRPMDVVAETLAVYLPGRVIKVPINPRSDAIFLSQSALSTFLLRHYDATDPVKAADLRTFMNTPNRYRTP